MENLVKDFLRQKNFAVVGSFRNESKYAFRILRILKEKGYKVYPVNPRLDEVDGLKCYKSVSDIPFSIDAVDVVTPQEVTERIVKECKEKGINRIWLQPGAESEKAIEFCKQNGIDVIHSLCVMMKSR
ncbi:MAG: CoA-binding protein [Candidatus Omnitrophica bacterium]|nr:CoA-binding protein [Candidatus Omnitrophota bacterium]MBU0878481.1 CoA-binding protein [Candidatus Omnitrophota bacterium]MBU1134432.1 CoA-binding protein [Candidatus Omnitrophota bacterium]MBU1367493.1 CoA-binding protein [Candidatus Omnitrophota bacterium]MBU1524554.1 CoA-binding protein [Candidatus Omnitrophota bacterium]